MNLQDLGITKEELVDKICEKFIDQMNDFEDYAFKVTDRIERIFNEKYNEIIKEKVDSVVDFQMLESFNAKYQPLDKWGEPKGEVTTLKEFMHKRMVSWWDEMVDRNGVPGKGYSYDTPRAQYFLRAEVERFLKDKAYTAMSEAMGQAKADINKELQSCLTSIISRHFTPIR